MDKARERIIKFSILIPVYNVGKYIGKCIESVLKQTYQDYEVILYDDASADDSGEICENYRKRYPDKIKVIHGTQNIGLCNGRIELAKYAVGEYCIFVDGDDLVSPQLLEVVSEAVDTDSPDIVMYDAFAHYEFRFGLQYNRECRFGSRKMFFHGETIRDYYRALATFQINAIWQKAFRRKVWELIEFDGLQSQIQIGEDLYFTLKLLEHTQTILYIPELLYYYRCNVNSMTHVFKENRIFDILRVCGFFQKSIWEKGVHGEEIEEQIFRHIMLSTIGFVTTMASKSCCLSENEREKLYLKIASEPLIIQLLREKPEMMDSMTKGVIGGICEGDYFCAENLIKQKRIYYLLRDTCGNLICR